MKTPEYHLIQLLKLEALSFEDIVKYTGWTHEKTTETIENCKASGAIAWKHKPSRYAVLSVPESQGIVELQRLSADLPTMRLGRHQRVAAHEYRQRAKESAANGVVAILDSVWAR